MLYAHGNMVDVWCASICEGTACGVTIAVQVASFHAVLLPAIPIQVVVFHAASFQLQIVITIKYFVQSSSYSVIADLYVNDILGIINFCKTSFRAGMDL